MRPLRHGGRHHAIDPDGRGRSLRTEGVKGDQVDTARFKASRRRRRRRPVDQVSGHAEGAHHALHGNVRRAYVLPSGDEILEALGNAFDLEPEDEDALRRATHSRLVKNFVR